MRVNVGLFHDSWVRLEPGCKMPLPMQIVNIQFQEDEAVASKASIASYKVEVLRAQYLGTYTWSVLDDKKLDKPGTVLSWQSPSSLIATPDEVSRFTFSPKPGRSVSCFRRVEDDRRIEEEDDSQKSRGRAATLSPEERTRHLSAAPRPVSRGHSLREQRKFTQQMTAQFHAPAPRLLPSIPSGSPLSVGYPPKAEGKTDTLGGNS